MKLEKKVIDRRLKLMEEEGVKFVTNINVGVDITAEQLLKDYDRVLLCCGASHPRDIKVPGRDAKGIYFAVDFLKQVTKSLLDTDFANSHMSLQRAKMFWSLAVVIPVMTVWEHLSVWGRNL